MKSLKQAIAASEVAENWTVPPLAVTVSVEEWAEWATQCPVDKVNTKAEKALKLLDKADDADAVRIVAIPVENGLKFSLQIEEGVLRLMAAKHRGHIGDRKGHKLHEGKKPEAKKCPLGANKCPADAKKCPADDKKCPADAKKHPADDKKKCPAETKKKDGDVKSDWAKRREDMKKKYIKKFDKNKDDKEKAAIREAARQRAADWMKERTEKSAAHIIVELDKNKDGKLNADEVPEKHRKHFGETDANNDGYVDEAELTKALKAAGEKMREHFKKHVEEHRKRHSK